MSTAWPTRLLGELCDVQIGKTPTRAEKRFWGGEHAWLSISDMNQGRELTTTSERVSQEAVHELNLRPVKPGTVLLSFKLSIGKVGVACVPMFTNEAIAHLPIIDNRIERDYLYWALRTVPLTDGADRAAMGAKLNKSKLNQIAVPLPPIEEQRRIAAALDAADSLRAKRRLALAKLDTLTQVIFIDMFDRAGEVWELQTVDALAAESRGSIRTGPFGSQLLHEEFADQGVAVLGIDNAVSNQFAWGERRFVTEEKYQELKRYTVFPGDVLVTIMGTCGRVAIVPDGIPRAINTKHLCCVTLDREKCLPEWLWASLRFDPRVLDQLGATHGAVMPGLNMGRIKEAEISVPPLEVQRRFAEVKMAAEHQAARASAAGSLVDMLFASLQQRAFRGEL